MKTLMLTITDEQASRLEERAAKLHLSVQESAESIIAQSLERTDFAAQFHQKPRGNWAEAFQQMHENGDDALLIDDVFEDETFEEWKA
jgi:hypothetical protein